MKKFIFLFALLTSFVISIFGSITVVKPTNGVLTYNKAYALFRESKLDSSIIYFKEAASILKIEKKESLEHICYLRIIGVNMALNEFKEAKLAFNNFEKLKLNKTNELNNKLPMAIYYELKTKYYLYNSKSDSVLKYSFLANKELEKIGTIGNNTRILLYNDLGNYFLESNDFKKAREQYEKANSILVSQSKNYFDCKLMASTLINFGNLQYYASNYDSAFIFYKKSGEIIKKSFGENHPQVAMAYSNMGLILELKCNFKEAKEYYIKSLNIYQKFFGEYHLSIAELYASLGFIYHSKKDYFNSKICFDKEFDIYFKLFGNDHPNVGLSCKNLGVVEKEMGNFDKSKILLNKAFENIKKNYGLNHSEIAEILLELGKLEQKSNVLKSIEIFKNAINITEKIEGDFSENKGDLLYQMAVSYSLVENEEKTILFSDSCIKTFEKVYNSKKHPKIIDAFLLISKSYIKQKKLSEALLFCNQGINLCFEKKPKFPEDLYNKNILFEFSVIKGMQLKTEILKTQNTNPKLGLVFAKDGLVFAQRLLQSLNSNEAQTEMLFEISSFCEKGIFFSKYLYDQIKSPNYLSYIFFFMENNKANLLKINNQTNEAIRFAGVPKKIIKKELDLKNKLSFLKNEKLYQIENLSNKEKILEIQNEIFGTNNELDLLKENIKKDYPEYFSLKYKNYDLDLIDFQKKLVSNVIVLEYFETDSGYLLLKIDKKNIRLFTILIPDKITAFNKLIESVIYEDDFSFASSSLYLYNLLIPDEIKNEINQKTLFIIREGLLQKIPFEILITEKPIITERTDWKYLLYQNPILYNFSANFLMEKKKASIFPNSKIWAISWLNPKNPLFGAKEEINKIRKIYPLYTTVDEALEETDFKNHVSNFGINHIATHAILNDSAPIYSYFTLGNDSLNDGNLYAYELYNLIIPAELSCLSACETGLGKDLKGDGPQSLARAFYYAGCKNLLISKWSLPDNSTARLINFYYIYLSKNENKIKALQKAKIDFLNKGIRYELSPLYWAGFELYGNQYDLLINKPFFVRYWKVFLLITIILSSLFAIYKIKKRPF